MTTTYGVRCAVCGVRLELTVAAACRMLSAVFLLWCCDQHECSKRSSVDGFWRAADSSDRRQDKDQ